MTRSSKASLKAAKTVLSNASWRMWALFEQIAPPRRWFVKQKARRATAG
jgi:hypothetical protein